MADTLQFNMTVYALWSVSNVYFSSFPFFKISCNGVKTYSKSLKPTFCDSAKRRYNTLSIKWRPYWISIWPIQHSCRIIFLFYNMKKIKIIQIPFYLIRAIGISILQVAMLKFKMAAKIELRPSAVCQSEDFVF